MKTASIALAALGVLIVFAGSPARAGDAAKVPAAAFSDVRGDDAIVFVEGAEAEPPAMPEGLASPEPQAAASPAPVTAAAPVIAAAPKESALKTTAPVKKRLKLRPLPAVEAAARVAVNPAPAPKVKPARAVFRLND